jgi:glutamate/aspartate transport system substrate-binding protein
VNSPRRVRSVILFIVMLLPGASLMAQGTLERIVKRNEFRIGYRTDARPLSFEQNGEAAGYSVDICRRIATSVKDHLKKADLKVTFVPVTSDNRFDAVVKGDVDIECGATTITLGRQERVDFSLMTFVTGGTVLSMADKRVGTMEELSGKRVAVIRDTTTDSALDAHLKKSLIDARVVKVADREEGMAKLRSGDVDAFASDQIVLMGEAMKALEQDRRASFSFADELFSYEPYALVVPRNDADFRLVVNRAIVQLFRGGQYAQLFQTWVGSAGVKPSPMLQAMYQIQTVAD